MHSILSAFFYNLDKIGDNMFKVFRNSDLAYYLYTAFVIILGIGSLVLFYFMVTGFNIGVYNPNTVMGSVYIGGLNEEEAREKVAERISEWFNDEDIAYEIGYQGYYMDIDRDIFQVDIEASFADINEGTDNFLSVEIDDADKVDLENQLNNETFMDGLENTFEFDSVIDSVLNDARELKQFSRHQLNDHLLDETLSDTLINSVSVPGYLDTDVSTILSRIEEHDEEMSFQIASHEVFSVLDQMPNNISTDELKTIGSGLLDLILPTEIEVHTLRHNMLLRDLETNPFVGRSVSVNRNQSVDFRIENVTYIDYTVHFYETDQGELGLELRGEPSLNTIDLDREDIILPYNQAPDGATITREGDNGMLVLIHRDIYDVYGENKSSTLLVFEYYEPIHEAYVED